MRDFDRIADMIADILRSPEKRLVTEGVAWARRNRAGAFYGLEYLAPVAQAGVIRGGLQARIACRSDLVDEDVHAAIEVFVPALNSYVRVQRLEWRPTRAHTNNGSAPAALRFRKFVDRYYDFGMNRRLGVDCLRQTATMIAQELRPIQSFNELLAFLGDMWNVQGTDLVPAPPWERRLV
jgi:hypothetical protein